MPEAEGSSSVSRDASRHTTSLAGFPEPGSPPLRPWAMAAIFFYHLWSVQPGGDQNPFGPILGDFLSQGYLGVVVFNAITGFVLTLPHADPGGKPALAFTDFFRRRFGRIVPQYYLSLALWTLVALVAGTM